jgi:hypothetical protein
MCAHSPIPCGGISLRAHFAGLALHGMLCAEQDGYRTPDSYLDQAGKLTTDPGPSESPNKLDRTRSENLALEAVGIADALIAELEGREA